MPSRETNMGTIVFEVYFKMIFELGDSFTFEFSVSLRNVSVPAPLPHCRSVSAGAT